MGSVSWTRSYKGGTSAEHATLTCCESFYSIEDILQAWLGSGCTNSLGGGQEYTAIKDKTLAWILQAGELLTEKPRFPSKRKCQEPKLIPVQFANLSCQQEQRLENDWARILWVLCNSRSRLLELRGDTTGPASRVKMPWAGHPMAYSPYTYFGIHWVLDANRPLCARLNAFEVFQCSKWHIGNWTVCCRDLGAERGSHLTSLGIICCVGDSSNRGSRASCYPGVRAQVMFKSISVSGLQRVEGVYTLHSRL